MRERARRRGEALAAAYLRLLGWRIIARRVKTPRGEIDLIARRGRTVAFIEVKWRARAAELDDSVDHHRLRRVGAAVEAVCARYARPGENVTIDVILIAPWRLPRRIANVWQPGA